MSNQKYHPLNANTRPLQLQESGLRTHKNHRIRICMNLHPVELFAFACLGGLDSHFNPIWLCDSTAGSAEPRCLEEVWRNYLFLAMKLLSLSKKSCWLHSVVFGLTRWRIPIKDHHVKKRRKKCFQWPKYTHHYSSTSSSSTEPSSWACFVRQASRLTLYRYTEFSETQEHGHVETRAK